MTRFYTLQEVYRAAWIWYKKSGTNSCCLAENRLMRGEIPPDLKAKDSDFHGG